MYTRPVSDRLMHRIVTNLPGGKLTLEALRERTAHRMGLPVGRVYLRGVLNSDQTADYWLEGKPSEIQTVLDKYVF